MASNERMRASRLAKYEKGVKDRKRLAKILRDERKKEQEKKKPVRDETIAIDKTSIPSRNPREVVASRNRQKNLNDKQVYDILGAVYTINKYIDQPGFTINIDYNNIRVYRSRMYRGYLRWQYPSTKDRISIVMREIPLDWVPITGNELLRDILIRYMRLSREEFKSWVVRENWKRYNLPSPLASARLERIELSPEDEAVLPIIKFHQQFQTTAYIRIVKDMGSICRLRKRFPLALLGKGKDLIQGFTETYETYLDKNGNEYDLTQQIRDTHLLRPSVSEEKKELQRRLAIAQDKLIETLYLAFFKDLTHWIIFILCKINERVVEPVPIKNNIISGCLPQHIDINEVGQDTLKVHSTWCYHIKSNINLFDRAFRGQKNVTEEYYRNITYKEYIAAKKAIAKREAQRNGKPWVKRLMNDDINLKF